MTKNTIYICDFFGINQPMLKEAINLFGTTAFFNHIEIVKSPQVPPSDSSYCIFSKDSLLTKKEIPFYNDSIPTILVSKSDHTTLSLPSNVIYLLHEHYTVSELSIALKLLNNDFEKKIKYNRLVVELEKEKKQLSQLNEIGVALSGERDVQKLLETILSYSLQMTKSDAGSIYIVENPKTYPLSERYKLENKTLRFKHTINNSITLPFKEFSIPLDQHSIAGYCASKRKSVNIRDVYNIPSSSPFHFNASFDKKSKYITRSMLTIPMLNRSNDPIGVIQLINKKRDASKKLSLLEEVEEYVLEFDEIDTSLMFSLASQAALAYESQMLFEEQAVLLDSLAKILASAIDKKSAYTGKHCARVPVITEMIAKAACLSDEPPFKSFNLTKEEWRELHLAAWLHDCGKVVTPVHIMDKSTKLEKIIDRIEILRLRFELLKRETVETYNQLQRSQSQLEEALKQIDNDFKFIDSINKGGEFLLDTDFERIKQIAKKTITIGNIQCPLITEEEVTNLCVYRGTLNKEERTIINNHIVATIDMLEQLPFPKNLSRIPEYAGAHHEKMDGTGYPNQLMYSDLAIPSKIMIIADIFEALTASDRPYKKPLPLSKVMSIMKTMKENNHFDPDIFNLFIREKVYLDYAKNYLPENLIDDVNEELLIQVVPQFIKKKKPDYNN